MMREVIGVFSEDPHNLSKYLQIENFVILLFTDFAPLIVFIFLTLPSFSFTIGGSILSTEGDGRSPTYLFIFVNLINVT